MLTEISSGRSKTLGITFALAFSMQAMAIGINDLSTSDTSSGLKEALTRGADIAVSQLGGRLSWR